MQTLLLTLALLPLAANDEPLAPWSNDRHPTDVPRREVRDIAAHRAEYSVVQEGTMDGQNCRSPHGVWQPFQQSWESNRQVRLENVGTTDVVNPWLSNGRSDFRSLQEIVARAVKPGMTDQDKALALWWQEIQYRFHFEGDNNELSSPVKVFNVYGHNTCGNDSICLAGQWKQAGLKVAPARLVGHCVSQVFFDGGWHLLDGDMHSIYLLRDNETIAGEQDLVRDHDLVKRTHSHGILESDRRAGDEWQSSIYVFEGDVSGDRNADGATSMNMTLRPGEALVWRWGHVNPVKYHGGGPPRFPDRICNGLWEYRPDFNKPEWRRGATAVEGIKAGDEGLSAVEGQTGTITWTMRSPYVFVGGKLAIEGSGAKFAISWDGKAWEDVDSDLDAKFPSQGTARYVYHLRCQLSGAAHLRKLAIINDIQMAPLTLPGMEVGKNAFVYTDQSTVDGKVQITHEWVERSASKPPAAPLEPVFPTELGGVEGSEFAFQWKPAVDPEGDAIADYHFELSSYGDMRWPLSMSFAKLISRTVDAGQARFTLAAPGQLNPDRKYFWHVRAQDSRGLWGPWSKTWSFTSRGPAAPQNLTLQFDGTQGILRWAPNPQGRKPASYRIYASDEKGFSISDEPLPVSTGISKELPVEFPANFLAEAHTAELPVVGADLSLERANKAFYRVVAVDAAGNRSGPSDYATTPRPFIFSKPPAKATKGEKYHYAVSAIRSLGDLRMRIVSGKETTNFWDVERPRFRIERGPSWLTIDKETGRLSGTPDSMGKSEVVVSATLERPLRRLDGDSLKWGVEKVVSTGSETVGTATQSFVIDVTP
ncbi:MAG TPA: hypothetical protein VGM05_17570 [Planctomycetaceae bacterium]|jgi:hypothetical protein